MFVTETTIDKTTAHLLTVEKIAQETDQAVIVQFAVPPEKTADFTFQAGQYLSLKTTLDGNEVRRAYSICTPPHSRRLQVAIKQVDKGKFSTYANTQLQVGDQLWVFPPQGHFILPDPLPAQGNYLMFCAGSGMTPILSLTEYILTTDKSTQVTLVYSNRNQRSILFKKHLTHLKASFFCQFNLIHLLSRETQVSSLGQGRLNYKKIMQIVTALTPQSIDHIYVCGPKDIVKIVKTVCKEVNLPRRALHFELF